MLFGDLAHGLKVASLFCFDTSFSGYTQDYADSDGGIYPMVRKSYNELGKNSDLSIRQ